jgi:hypothetical protein
MPSVFSTSSTVLASNADLFHACASASSGFSQPAATSSVKSVTPPPDLSQSLRVVPILDLLEATPPFDPGAPA